MGEISHISLMDPKKEKVHIHISKHESSWVNISKYFHTKMKINDFPKWSPRRDLSCTSHVIREFRCTLTVSPVKCEVLYKRATLKKGRGFDAKWMEPINGCLRKRPLTRLQRRIRFTVLPGWVRPTRQPAVTRVARFWKECISAKKKKRFFSKPSLHSCGCRTEVI